MSSHLLRNRRVLIVEDEYLLAIDLRRELRRVGAVVIGPVPSIDLALELVDTTPSLDLAALDVRLQGEMAYPVADVLVERGIPFVFTTGYLDGDLGNRYPQVIRCTKPIEFRKLEKAFISVLQPTSPAELL